MGIFPGGSRESAQALVWQSCGSIQSTNFNRQAKEEEEAELVRRQCRAMALHS